MLFRYIQNLCRLIDKYAGLPPDGISLLEIHCKLQYEIQQQQIVIPELAKGLMTQQSSNFNMLTKSFYFNCNK